VKVLRGRRPVALVVVSVDVAVLDATPPARRGRWLAARNGAKISSVERESVRWRRHRAHKRSLARQLFLMQAAVIVVTGAVGVAVAVPLLDRAIGADLVHELPRLLGVAALALAVGAVLSLLVAAHVARKTHGLEAREITKLYEHNEAVLHAIREGVLVTDRDGRLLLANDEARRLLELPEDAEGRLLGHGLPNGSLRALLASQRSTRDETHLVGGRVLIVNQSQAFVDDRSVGVVTTFRDRTELESLLRELDTMRGLADSLRAQGHETANQLQAMVGLVELGRYEEAVEFATEQVATAQELLSRLQDRVREPALVGMLLGKSAAARERGIELEISGSFAAPGVSGTALVTIVGNLIDNAFDAVADVASPHVDVRFRSSPEQATVEVRDSGPGVPSYRVFEVGWTTKPAINGSRGLGLALVRQTVIRYGGSISMRNDRGAIFKVVLPLNGKAPQGSQVAG
jgi:two-component system CitB family sensor kinase